LGDYLSEPVKSSGLFLTDGRALPYPGRHLVAFTNLGGRANPGPLGSLAWGSKTLEAFLISPPGPQLIFLTPKSWPLNETQGRALWEPTDDLWLPPGQAGVPGINEFLDPQTGWLRAVKDFEPHGQSKDPLASLVLKGWEEWPAKIPLGVSFMWQEKSKTPQTAAQIIDLLPKEESLWIISDQEDFLGQLAQILQNKGLPLVALGPALDPALQTLELNYLIDQKSSLHAEKLAAKRSQLDFQRQRQRDVQAKLQKWEYLKTLEGDLVRLTNEVKNRETVWAFHSGELAQARDSWVDTAPRRSFWSIFKRKKSHYEKNLADTHLQAAETEMARVRREKTSLLEEAKKLTEKLEATQDLVKTLPKVETLSQELLNIESQSLSLSQSIGDLALAWSRSGETHNLLSQKPVLLIYPGWGAESLADFGAVDNLLLLGPHGHNPLDRRIIAQSGKWPVKRLITVGDFTSWAWEPSEYSEASEAAEAAVSSEPDQDVKFPPSQPVPQKAYYSYLAPSTAASPNPLDLLGPLPQVALQSPPDPGRYPFLAELGLKSVLNSWNWPGPWGPVWRGLGDYGPFCPVSALASVQLALKAREISSDLIYILAPSPGEGILLRTLIQDLAPGSNNIAAGEPAELADWPKAALVILDTALGPNPWNWPDRRSQLLEALRLTDGALVIIGQPETSDESVRSPLAKLWQAAQPFWPKMTWPPKTTNTLWQALDQALREGFFCFPVFEPHWWAPLSLHFQAALNRQVKITILAQVPPEDKKEYCGTVIRDLKLFGAQVILSEGFSDLFGLIDQKHFNWGLPGRVVSGRLDWNNLWNMEIPSAGPHIAEVIQAPLIAEKLGPRGFRNCPQCGWPYVLINNVTAKDFNHRQPLRLGCLNPGCPNHHNPRRLDERWPFLTPPVCPKNNITSYVRIPKGRSEIWFCPDHEDCPQYKVIPGDAKSRK
jgi:hypothetical protein